MNRCSNSFQLEEDRKVFAAIIYLLRTGIQWNAFGPFLSQHLFAEGKILLSGRLLTTALTLRKEVSFLQVNTSTREHGHELSDSRERTPRSFLAGMV